MGEDNTTNFENKGKVILLELQSRREKALAETKIVTNYDSYMEGKVERKLGLSLTEMSNKIKEHCNGWPKKIGDDVCFLNKKNEIDVINNTDAFLAYIGRQFNLTINWGHGEGLHTKVELFQAFKTDQKDYDSYEELPHYPPIEGVYYLKKYEPVANPELFDKFISFFNPATELDKTLIKAMVLTLFWGGSGGQRPAFVLMAKDDDEESGRGVGKSTLTDILAELSGGMLDFSARVEEDIIKKAIFTSQKQRMIRFDNIKVSKFSSSDIESFITTDKIAGLKMYKGTTTRTNLFTYIFTFNDAGFSKDMAQRAIPIRLDRPKEYSDNWRDDLFQFVADNKQALICHIGSILTGSGIALKNKNRFGKWCGSVMNKVTEDKDIIAKITFEQNELDGDEAIIREIEGVIRANIMNFRIGGGGSFSLNEDADPDKHNFYIKRTVLLKWINTDLNLQWKNQALHNMLNKASIAQVAGEITYNGIDCVKWRPVGNKTFSYYVIMTDFRSKRDLGRPITSRAVPECPLGSV